jgi:hypothetical protein
MKTTKQKSYWKAHKAELVDEEYGINFMKGKHDNIISHPLSHIRITYLFNHFPTPITQPI